MNLLIICNSNVPNFVQNERHASAGDFVRIFISRESISCLVSPFLQMNRQRKMAITWQK